MKRLDYITRELLYLFAAHKKNSHMRRLAFFLAMVVVFTTTYALILPAISLELDVAEEMPGISLEDDINNQDMSADTYDGYDELLLTGEYDGYEEPVPLSEPALEYEDDLEGF